MRTALISSQVRLARRHGAGLLALGTLLAGCASTDGGDPVPVPDTQPPTVDLLTPAVGPVRGIIEVSAAAFDNRGVVGVVFTLDGAPIGAEDTSVPYSITWNTATATNGAHLLSAIARDAAGFTGTAPDVAVNVSGGT